MARDKYEQHARIVIDQLFPQWPDEARASLVWLLVDFLLSLDGICAKMPEGPQ
jgi:hypothetical protein